jgi:hypothetical protein
MTRTILVALTVAMYFRPQSVMLTCSLTMIRKHHAPYPKPGPSFRRVSEVVDAVGDELRGIGRATPSFFVPGVHGCAVRWYKRR